MMQNKKKRQQRMSLIWSCSGKREYKKHTQNDWRSAQKNVKNECAEIAPDQSKWQHEYG